MTRGEGRRDQDRGAFGTASQLPSGRWRAMYWHDGQRHKAPTTFTTKGEARKFLATQQADIVRGKWLPPVEPEPANTTKEQTLAAYADQWLPNRLIDGQPLKDRTSDMYRKMLDVHIIPVLGHLPVSAITGDDVRDWHAKTLTKRPAFRARAYGLLRTILTTAVTDGKLAVNPCMIRGAGSARRQIIIEPASLDELGKLVEAMPKRFQAMVLLAAWCALRFGELTELRRDDINLEEGVVHVRRGVVYLRKRGASRFVVTTPKSRSAGKRDVAIPPHLIPALRDHLGDHTDPGKDSLLFPAFQGGHLHQATMQVIFGKAREAAGRPDLRFHDLRHTGAVLAASTGATLAELMARLGHSTVGAAMRYQHCAEGADQRIAAALSKLVVNGLEPAGTSV